MTQTRAVNFFITTCASCESACITNAIESAATTGQDRVAKVSTERAAECREIRQQLAKNPNACTERLQAACVACMTECERNGPISLIRKKCLECCRTTLAASTKVEDLTD